VNIDPITAPAHKTDVVIRFVPDASTMLGTEVAQYRGNGSLQE
jgi:hypothetical protein